MDESILFALRGALVRRERGLIGGTDLAISMAVADHGAIVDGVERAGDSPSNVPVAGWIREGEMKGEEKQRRYSAMKKSSFNAQQTKSTFWGHVSRGIY